MAGSGAQGLSLVVWYLVGVLIRAGAQWPWGVTAQ